MHTYPEHWSIAPATAPLPMPGSWANTEPMRLDALLESRPRPFREVMRGLQVRELSGDEIFRRYFASDEH